MASIPKGITAEHVRKALAELDAGVSHPFDQPTTFQLVHDGRRYTPKAVIGLAARHAFGKPLGVYDFSGGEGPGQANSVLRKLGFVVERMSDRSKDEPRDRSRGSATDWTQTEVDLIVADYFSMLQAEMTQQRYSKTEHRNALRPLLNGRSDASIEFKHQNISAVLVHLGLPYIEGYKPMGNYQALLAEAVERYVNDRPSFLTDLEAAPRLNPVSPPPIPKNLDSVFEPAPDRIIVPGEPPEPWKSRGGQRIDFARRDAENRHMGRLGEEFVVTVEQMRLKKARRDDLAKKVEHVAVTQGDGLGYDVLSFEAQDESEKLIEVKTTGAAKSFPFYVTDNEVRCSEAMAEQYRLYRVFDFAQLPRLFELKGSLRETCRLDPVQYRASF